MKGVVVRHKSSMTTASPARAQGLDDGSTTDKVFLIGLRVILLAFFLLLAREAAAENTKLTVYDDGLSCPGNCDAHVVFHPSMNGSSYARLPESENAKCVTGKVCEVCFDGDSGSCMKVMYRGGGPTRLTFDFTPAFYRENCKNASAPQRLRDQCASLAKQAKDWRNKTSCIQKPDENECESVIKAARAAQKKDRSDYVMCIKEGEAAYNKRVESSMRRSNKCAYELTGTGKNSKGTTWRRLLAGACRDGTYVGRDGLDCCSGSPDTDRFFGSQECRSFYVERTK